MPSLADTLQQNKNSLVTTRDANGNLVQQGPQGVQQLAANAGLPAPPVTAAGTAAIGGTPDQQKMAGTPQQKQAALTIAQQPQQNLQTALREGQARTQQTGAEQAETQKSQSLKDLGQMGDRVNDFINSQRAKLTTAANGPGVQVSAQSAGTNAAGQQQDLTSVQPLLSQLRADPTNQQLMLQVNKALGYDVNTQLDPSQINQLYQDSTSAIAAGGAGVVDDKLTVAQLTQDPKFGYTTQQLSGLLGIPEDQLSGMNVAQIHDQVSKVMTDEFNKSQQLGQQAQSTELGGAQRAQAASLGREASATGIRATEDDFKKLNTSIANADQVSFGGKQMSVEDMLSNDNISKTITDYINSAPGSAARTQLEKTEPGLVDFINKNQAVLADAASKLSAGAQTFQETQAANKQLSTFGGSQISDDLMSKLVPGWGQLSADKLTVGASPVLAQIDSIRNQKGDEAAAAAVEALNTAQKQDPSLADQMSGLSEQQIHSLDIGNPNGLLAQWQKAKADAVANQAITDPGDALKKMTGDTTMTVPKMEELIAQNTAAGTLGFGPQYKSPITVGKDGHIDTDSVVQSIRGTGVPSLQDALGGKLQGVQQVSVNQPTLDATQYRILHKLGGAARNGYVSYSDLQNAGLTPEEASYLYKQNAGGNYGMDVPGLTHFKNDAMTPATNDKIASLDDVPADRVNGLEAMLGDKSGINEDLVNTELKKNLDATYNSVLADPIISRNMDTLYANAVAGKPETPITPGMSPQAADMYKKANAALKNIQVLLKYDPNRINMYAAQRGIAIAADKKQANRTNPFATGK